jgi:hypothetical protein
MVHLTHPDLPGAEHLSPKDAVSLWTARGWVASDAVPEHLDPDAPNRGDVALAADPQSAAPAAAPSTAEASAEAADTTDPHSTEAAVAEVNTTKEKNRA